jgi:hypothetical protein
MLKCLGWIIVAMVLAVIIGVSTHFINMKAQSIAENPLPENCVKIQVGGNYYYTNDYEIKSSGVIEICSFYEYNVFDFNKGYEKVGDKVISNNWIIVEGEK